MKTPIEIYMISGFLGSGKTTFLTQFLESFADKKVGILVNELGTINIDGVLIEKNGITMTEITSGSIYCYCKQADFITVLKEFSSTDIDILLIENSGMADPSNIHRILPQGVAENGRSYNYMGAICILDTMTFINHVSVLPSIANQVKSSNFIILNKVDMVSSERIKASKEAVYNLNKDAHIIETIYAEVTPSEISNYLKDNGYDGDTTNKCYNKFKSYSIETKEVITAEQIESFVEGVKSSLYRIKGFVRTEDKWLHIDVIEDTVIIKDTEIQKKQHLNCTKLVFIGRDDKEYKELLAREWKSNVASDFTIYE